MALALSRGMTPTVPGKSTARKVQVIAPLPTVNTMLVNPNSRYARGCRIAAAIVAPQGHAISLVLRTMVARRAFLSVR